MTINFKTTQKNLKTCLLLVDIRITCIPSHIIVHYLLDAYQDHSISYNPYFIIAAIIHELNYGHHSTRIVKLGI